MKEIMKGAVGEKHDLPSHHPDDLCTHLLSLDVCMTRLMAGTG